MWRIRLAPNNANKWQMGFNSVFKGLMFFFLSYNVRSKYTKFRVGMIHVDTY